MLKFISSPVELSAYFLSEIAFPAWFKYVSFILIYLFPLQRFCCFPDRVFPFLWNSSSLPAYLSRSLAYAELIYPPKSLSPQWVFLTKCIILLRIFDLFDFFSFVATFPHREFAFTFISYASWGILGTKICFYILLFKPILLSRFEDFNLHLLS